MDYMEINISFDGDFKNCPDDGWFQAIAEKTLAAEKTDDNAEMSLLITGQERIQQLNKAYRNQDKPTDVLSFALLADAAETAFSAPPDGLKHLGEVIISYPQAEMQAQEHNHPVRKELALLVIHGVLHLLGYDHMEDAEADIMETKQNKILRSLKEALE